MLSIINNLAEILNIYSDEIKFVFLTNDNEKQLYNTKHTIAVCTIPVQNNIEEFLYLISTSTSNKLQYNISL